MPCWQAVDVAPVMFADIRGFTSFSQYLPPEQVVQELNSLLEVMVKCTFDYEGTLDKFIGDAILVLFNAPLDQADHTERAVKTAIAIQKSLRDHASGLKVGIGVHSGPAVIGNIGTPQRMEFTAIGHALQRQEGTLKFLIFCPTGTHESL